MNVESFANQRGYESVLHEGTWNGYEVYKPVLGSGKRRVGIPLRILVKDGKCRMTTYEETFSYIRSRRAEYT